MASFAEFSLAFALAGLTAVTSGSAQTGKQHTVIVVPPQNMSCPIAMRAEHGTGGGLQVVKGGAAHSGIGQQMQLTLDNPWPAAISAIRITFHGWDGTGRTLPTKSSEPAKSTEPAVDANTSYANASRTLDLAVSISPQKSADMLVWVSGLTAVDSIDLDSVSYADGSSWEPQASQACRIVPDTTMLISNR